MGLEDKRYYALGKSTYQSNYLLSQRGTQLWYTIPEVTVWAKDREGERALDWWEENFTVIKHNQIVDILWGIRWD